MSQAEMKAFFEWCQKHLRIEVKRNALSEMYYFGGRHIGTRVSSGIKVRYTLGTNAKMAAKVIALYNTWSGYNV